ncbi:DUF6908 domain-containing protein [Pedobacter paludis]|nr:hypothetical protein [Pedobacter paludis]
MESLDLNSTKIFCELLERMNGKGHCKLLSPGYTPLTIEKLGGKFSSIWGKGHFYSLCHYCKRQGDLMQDPEMCFLVVDNREFPQDFESVHILPYSFQNALLGIYEESITFLSDSVGVFLPRKHSEHLDFATMWLENIKFQFPVAT